MKYVFNKGRYAVAFDVQYKGLPRSFTFDRRRVYLDTGNIATTGITEVEDEVYELLLKNARFKELIDSKEFELVDSPKIKDSADDALKAENEKLKQELAEAKKKDNSKTSKEEIKAKEAEIASLKAQLNALTKKDKKADKETEGF